jgi:hypothetical protein
MDMIVIWK